MNTVKSRIVDASLFKNPFTETKAGKYFVGREEEIDQFKYYLNGLRSGNPNHFYVAGVHGTGKTFFSPNYAR